MQTIEKRFGRLVPKEAKGQLERSGAPFRRVPFGKPLLYLGAHILGYGSEKDGEMQEKNAEMAVALERRFSVFIPQEHNPYGILKEKSQGFEMALVDAESIRKARIFVAVGGFGKDTSWECGFAAGRKKQALLVLPDAAAVEYHRNDWMLMLTFGTVVVPKGMKERLENSVAMPPDVRIVEFEKNAEIADIAFDAYKKQALLHRLKGYWLAARMYSGMEYPMMNAVAKMSVPGAKPEVDAEDGFKAAATLAYWWAFNWHLESEHEHMHRPRISRKAAKAALALAATAAAIANLRTIPLSILYHASYFVYSKKEGESDFLGKASFAVRGVSQIVICLISQLLYTPAINAKQLAVAGAVGMLTAARNLIGDLRDIRYDEKTFCVAYGKNASNAVVATLKFGAAGILASVAGTVFAPFPLIVEGAMQFFSRNNHDMHRLSVLGTAATLGNVALAFAGLAPGIILINLLYVSGMFNLFFYRKLARRSNADYEAAETGTET